MLVGLEGDRRDDNAVQGRVPYASIAQDRSAERKKAHATEAEMDGSRRQDKGWYSPDPPPQGSSSCAILSFGGLDRQVGAGI